MKNRFFLMLMALSFVFCSTITASATTIDLLGSFDTNSDGIVKFGDKTPRLDKNYALSVEKQFSLSQSPLLPGNLEAYAGYNNVDYRTSDNFSIIGFTLTYDPTEQSSSPVPEPSTRLVLGIGLLGLAGTGRRNK